MFLFDLFHRKEGSLHCLCCILIPAGWIVLDQLKIKDVLANKKKVENVPYFPSLEFVTSKKLFSWVSHCEM